ncbi:helix-turn-helix domain-containing protein [Spongiibacter marinus]|jgi:AraC-like DNA-binding protein|uniref:helix-turn-helix domain-containing protein n=1 Tax=Spongiibacter marinus TaxID=354246 RepID=UPI000485992B|nr:AraC family transcriptional regulator [Spongiibacter marinus]
MGAAHWHGEAALAPGIGLFRGHSGDNRAHRHWAHQISLALDGTIEFNVNDIEYCGAGFLIPAGVKHRQLEANVFSVYVDPTSSFLDGLNISLSHSAAIHALSDASIQKLVSLFPADCALSECLALFFKAFETESSRQQADPKLTLVLAELKKAIDDNVIIDREQLARICHLSPSRFSHWFSQETGMPLRSYRKWLRLIKALETAVLTGSLNRAGVDAGFSDQSHFNRAVSEAFGVRPTDILELLG